jgi:hypothetical protein
VAAWFGRNTRGFSRGAIGFRFGSVVCVLEEAGQRWRRAGGMLLCRFWCGAGSGGVQMHGNTLHALRVLGGTVASGWHGRGAVCSGSGVAASSGIGQTRAEEFDGEATGPDVGGAVQPRMGVHDGHGDGAGGMECSSCASARWGRGLGASRVAFVHWGSRAVPG